MCVLELIVIYIEEGFGRTDALARIGNTVFGDNLSDENYHVATGPVSYPPVWNIWKFDWVQYGASVKQPMARNMGEALGVGAHINFMNPYGEPLKPEQRFNSGVLVENIYDIETTLQALTPPPWPEKLFGEIDHEKAAKGKVLFKQHCQGCHGPFTADETLKHINITLKNKTSEILTNYPVADHNKFSITFHESLADAQSGSNSLNENKYQNTSNNQTIYVRVVNNQTKCVHDDLTFNIIINPLPFFTVDSPVIVCLNAPQTRLEPINPVATYDYEWVVKGSSTVLSSVAFLDVTKGGTYLSSS